MHVREQSCLHPSWVGDALMHAAWSSCRKERAQHGGRSRGSRVPRRWPRAPRLLAAQRALGLQRVPVGAAAIPLEGLRCRRRVRQRAGQPGTMAAAAALGARSAGRWLAVLCSRGASGSAMVSASRVSHPAFLPLAGWGRLRAQTRSSHAVAPARG